ncbi:MAG: hypothetical protein ACK56F_16460, partial [bacterium]
AKRGFARTGTTETIAATTWTTLLTSCRRLKNKITKLKTKACSMTKQLLTLKRKRKIIQVWLVLKKSTFIRMSPGLLASLCTLHILRI